MSRTLQRRNWCFNIQTSHPYIPKFVQPPTPQPRLRTDNSFICENKRVHTLERSQILLFSCRVFRWRWAACRAVHTAYLATWREDVRMLVAHPPTLPTPPFTFARAFSIGPDTNLVHVVPKFIQPKMKSFHVQCTMHAVPSLCAPAGCWPGASAAFPRISFTLPVLHAVAWTKTLYACVVYLSQTTVTASNWRFVNEEDNLR